MSNGGTPRGDKHPEQPSNELATSDDGPESHLVPGDDTYRDDKQFVADLTSLNGQISRYVLRMLDADTGRISLPSPHDERALAEAMTILATKVQKRADRRPPASGTPPVLEDSPARRQLTNGRPSERC